MERFFSRPTIALNVSNLTDARYFSARMLDAIAYAYDPFDETQLSEIEITAISEWVEGIQSFISLSGPDYPDYMKKWADRDISGYVINMLFLDFEIDYATNIKFYLPISHEIMSSYIWQNVCALLEKSRNDIIIELNDNIPFSDIYSKLFQEYEGSLYLVCHNSTQLKSVKNLNNIGIAVLGGSEEQTGVKNYDEIDDILDELELWD